MTPKQRKEADEIIRELERRASVNRIDTYYPDNGPLRRDLYTKHMQFFAAGASKAERLMLAANRVGKTEGVGGYESALHLTGVYPPWWPGRRFSRPVSGWAGGDTATTVRDIIQYKLLGKPGEYGTGILRGDSLKGTTNKRGVPDAVENIYVKHISGGTSVLQLKSYDQGREAWQGTEKDFVWLDEEPPIEIYTEALLRLMTTNGLMMNTYTPIEGMTEVTQSFLENDSSPSKYYVVATWDDAPHLTKEQKDQLWASIPPHERQARAQGIPSIGVGLIYAVDLSAIFVDPFEVPKHYVRGFGLDVGWNRTAAVFGALDRDSDALYIYSEHYQGEQQPAVHASAIKARGKMTGFIDPASRGRSQIDGRKLLQMYRDEGLSLLEADNAVETGIFEVYQRLTTGRLFIFNTLTNLRSELSMYHRDKKGAVVKKNDHLMDAMRYLCMSHSHMHYVSGEGNYSTTNGGTRYLSAMPARRYRG